MSKNIVLTGLSGSGKTTIGNLLQKKFPNFSFVDTDAMIVQEQGRSINEIFEVNGENFFRDLETKKTEKLSEQRDLIISTGGGIVLREENMLNLKKNGLVFYLKVSPEVLANRLEGKTDRPLLKVSDLFEKLKSMLVKRSVYYEKADVVIETDEMSENDTVEEIARIYNERC